MGWRSKVNDETFQRYLCDFHVILLQETWSQIPLHLQGFNSYNIPAYRISSKGRLQVGMTIFVSSQLNSELVVTKTTSKLCHAVKLILNHLQLIIGKVYLPPGLNSQLLSQNWSTFSKIVKELDMEFPSCHWLIGGDFNARLGNSEPLLSTAANLDPDSSLLDLFS